MKTIKFRKALLIISLAFIGTQLFAQELFEIKVKLVKHQSQLAQQATAILLDSKTMEIVAENISNTNNEVIFENVKRGEYILVVQKPGYKNMDTRRIVIDDKITVFNNSDQPTKESTIKS